MFNGWLIEKTQDQSQATFSQIDDDALPDGEILVEVDYSTINYKDALAITGAGPVVRSFPMVPGIDFSGRVLESKQANIAVGDAVILNGWGVGESHWGGLAERARVKGDWLTPLPDQISAQQAMAIGTAGFTAMLCIMALEKHGVTPASGDVLVTGATGGVGSIAITILAKLGYDVVALSGRTEEAYEYLTDLGAKRVLPRSTFSVPGKPLQKANWAGVIDVAGSHVLANACASTQYGGVVAACGLAGGMDFPSTVAPFILRGVTLVGIDSVLCPQPLRNQAWQRLARDLDMQKLEMMTKTIRLADVKHHAKALLNNQSQGRLVVKVKE
ncbi:Alcohol dehydrogenase [Methylophaga frappieri]|uniref:Alcohol dehydrogenase n=1 Tax=Methylophaga frappieri (strain ATCC BAA-2434 / DSM 25690 / JAM7) TaxID=754477 RepID=I1YLM2_METFJ|nr:MDR family oxidoreductase [Methylophaga frappieri]AFJ03815.1 Alcohol dehydrogenase [Methylophaga frappieri]